MNSVHKAVIKEEKERRRAEAMGDCHHSFCLRCWCLLHWWRSVAVPGHAHSGRASWSAGRWRLGPLSRLVALWPPAAAAQWPEKGRPPTWPGPPLCTGACPCQSLVDGSAVSSEESIWPELRWVPPQPPAREPEELGSLDWEALGGQSWVEMSEQTSVDTTGVRIDSNKRRVGERDQTVL